MNDIFGLAHRIIFKVNVRWDWGWKSQRIIKFSPYKITAIVKQNHFQNIMKFWILKCSIIERTKFTIQTFPCINICCFGIENGEFKWFHLYLITPSSIQRENVGLSCYDSIKAAIQVQCFYFMLTLVTSPG